jgi:hypothetical protein
MKAIKKAVAVVGTYKDRQTGADKKQYLTIGKLFQREDGSLSMKMDAAPVNFDGWINFYDLETAQPQAKQASGPVGFADLESSDIPFSNHELKVHW